VHANIDEPRKGRQNPACLAFCRPAGATPPARTCTSSWGSHPKLVTAAPAALGYCCGRFPGRTSSARRTRCRRSCAAATLYINSRASDMQAAPCGEIRNTSTERHSREAARSRQGPQSRPAAALLERGHPCPAHRGLTNAPCARGKDARAPNSPPSVLWRAGTFATRRNDGVNVRGRGIRLNCYRSPFGAAWGMWTGLDPMERANCAWEAHAVHVGRTARATPCPPSRFPCEGRGVGLKHGFGFGARRKHGLRSPRHRGAGLRWQEC